MPRSVSTAFDWTMIAAALGLLLYVLVSPTGSFVRSPMPAATGDAGAYAAAAIPAESAAARAD